MNSRALLLIAALVLVSLLGSAQFDPDPVNRWQHVASGGELATSGSISIAQSLGQVLIGDLDSGGDVLTVGFHQSDPGCSLDLNGDGTIGTSDLLIVIAAFGCSPCGSADVSGDGSVGTSDVLAILAAFGSSC